MITKPPYHEANGSEFEESESVVSFAFPIFRQPPTAIKPTDRALNDPSFWNDFKPLGDIGAFHDFNIQVRQHFLYAVTKNGALITAVCKKNSQQRMFFAHLFEKHQAPVTILNAGRMHNGEQQ